MKGKLVHVGACLVLLLLIQRLKDLTSSFANLEITRTYQFFLKIMWNIAFLKELHWIIISKNKKIGKILQDLISFN